MQPIPSGIADGGEENEPRFPNPVSGSPCPNNGHTNPLYFVQLRRKSLLPQNQDFLFAEKRYHYFIFLSDLTVDR